MVCTYEASLFCSGTFPTCRFPIAMKEGRNLTGEPNTFQSSSDNFRMQLSADWSPEDFMIDEHRFPKEPPTCS